MLLHRLVRMCVSKLSGTVSLIHVEELISHSYVGTYLRTNQYFFKYQYQVSTRVGEFSPTFFNYRRSPNFCPAYFHGKSFVFFKIILTKNGLGYIWAKLSETHLAVLRIT
jgi:hypothetical protein